MKKASLYFILIFSILTLQSCNYITHRTYQKTEIKEDEDPEPIYDVTLDDDYQNFVEFMFLGNRSESFSTFFNKFYTATENFNEGMDDYEQTYIANYNPSLDSLGAPPPASAAAKENFNKVIETCSKIIQYNKNTRFFDDAVILIGKSYYYQQDYLQAERKFNEFISKLSKSNFYDEAILYLGRTKIRLRNVNDGEKILNDLFSKTKDNEVKSDITEELANINLYRRNFDDAVKLLNSSIDFTKDKDKKARKQYLLAKIFLLNDPDKAAKEYDLVLKNTSDFDLTFYAKLNKYIALNKVGKYSETQKGLADMNKEYRDYPELRQLSDYELATTYFYEKKYDIAITKFYDIIMDYPGTKVASNSYYFLGNYYENVKHDYLNALINYKKSATTTGLADYSAISNKKYVELDKYFTLQAEIHDTTKIEIPDENPEFIKYRDKKLKEKGEFKEPEIQPKQEGKGFGEGMRDSIKNDNGQELNPPKVELPGDSIIQKENFRDSLIKHIKDSIPSIKDTVVQKDTVNHALLDSLLKIRQEDSLRISKINRKFDAYIELAELFLINIGIQDSAIKYINYLIDNDTLSARRVKALYMLSTIYRNTPGKDAEANNLLNEIIKKYPATDIANEARRQLGINQINIEKDSSDVIYNSAAANLHEGNYRESLEELKNIIYSYPTSSVYPKSLLAIGYIYENALVNKDSAIKYYKLLTDKFPESEYAQYISPKVTYLISQIAQKDSTGISRDSLGITPDTLRVKKDTINLQEEDSARYVIDSLINPLENNIPEKIVIPDTLLNIPIDTIPEEQNIEMPKETIPFPEGTIFNLYRQNEFFSYFRKELYFQNIIPQSYRNDG